MWMFIIKFVLFFLFEQSRENPTPPLTPRMLAVIFTGRNEVVAKVMFLHVSVILSTGGRVSGQAPPQDQADTPRQGEPPPGPGRPPPREGSLQHTVNERPVRILLECILVEILLTISGCKAALGWELICKLNSCNETLPIWKYVTLFKVHGHDWVGFFCCSYKRIYNSSAIDLNIPGSSLLITGSLNMFPTMSHRKPTIHVLCANSSYKRK